MLTREAHRPLTVGASSVHDTTTMGLQLQLETTNVCDADCVFCPYSQMTRPKGTMDLDLFDRLIAEAATIPVIEQITLTGLGEPLLDRFLVERIRRIRRAMPPIPIDLYTNGSFLRPRIIDALVDAGLSILYVSLNATNAESRKAIMRVDNYDQVVESIQYARALGGDRMRVVVKGIVSKDLMEAGDNEQFAAQWGGPFTQPGGSAFLHLEGNWAGAVGAPMRVKPKAACSRALGQIMVLWDGRVSLCCFDAHGQVILGDLRTQSLREIYGGPLAVSIREAHVQGRRGELPLCQTCTGI